MPMPGETLPSFSHRQGVWRETFESPVTSFFWIMRYTVSLNRQGNVSWHFRALRMSQNATSRAIVRRSSDVVNPNLLGSKKRSPMGKLTHRALHVANYT